MKKEKEREKKQFFWKGDRYKITKSCPITERKTAAERGERDTKKGTKGFHFHRVFVEKERKRQTKKPKRKRIPINWTAARRSEVSRRVLEEERG